MDKSETRREVLLSWGSGCVVPQALLLLHESQPPPNLWKGQERMSHETAS